MKKIISTTEMAEGLSYNTLIRIARDVGLDPDRTMKRGELLEFITTNGPPEITAEKIRQAMAARGPAPVYNQQAAQKKQKETEAPAAPFPPVVSTPAPAPTTAPAVKKRPKPKIRVRDVDPKPRLTKADIEKMARRKAERVEAEEPEPPPPAPTPVSTAATKRKPAAKSSGAAPAPASSGFVHPKHQDKTGRWRWADGPQKGKFCKKE